MIDYNIYNIKHICTDRTATYDIPPVMKKRSNILVVDDDVTFNRIMVDMLRKNYYTLTAYDGRMAVDIACRKKPDIVLLDTVIPKIDGFEVCRILRADLNLKGTKIIFLSAKREVADRLYAYDLGADDYITKPLDIFELLAKINATARSLEQIRPIPEYVRAIFCWIDDTVYVTAEGNYATFYGYHNTAPLGSVRATLKAVQRYFTRDLLKVHRSYLISCREFRCLGKDNRIMFRKPLAQDPPLIPAKWFVNNYKNQAYPILSHLICLLTIWYHGIISGS